MNSDLQKQIALMNDLYVSSSSSGRLFAMKEVRDLQAIVNKSVQSENDKYEGQSVIKAMHKVAEHSKISKRDTRRRTSEQTKGVI